MVVITRIATAEPAESVYGADDQGADVLLKPSSRRQLPSGVRRSVALDGLEVRRFGLFRSEALLPPPRDAGEIEDAEKYQHQADGKFHGKAEARRDRYFEQNDGCAGSG